MRRLAVMAHYDPTGGIAPHVQRHVQALLDWCDDVAVVTTATLTASSRSWLAERVRLIERENEGYDFYSYKVGLDASDLASYDEVVLCNDTYVGPLKPYPEIFAAMEDVVADFWGFTASEQIAPHIQSFFLVFRSAALRSGAFADFWREMEPISKRFDVVRRYEIGLSERLTAAGLQSAAYFAPAAAEQALGRRRVHWLTLRKKRLPRTANERREFRQLWSRAPNPSIAHADAVFDDGRLPIVKLDTLRYDPYGLDANALLAGCERLFPETFDGVRDFIDQTAAHYPVRKADRLRPTPRWLRPFRRGVVYRVP